MPHPPAAAIPLSADQKAQLESLVRAHSTPHQVALRARIILLAGEGVVERGGELGLGAETAEEPGVVGQRPMQHFHRDATAEAHVVGDVHTPGRTRTDDQDDGGPGPLASSTSDTDGAGAG